MLSPLSFLLVWPLKINKIVASLREVFGVDAFIGYNVQKHLSEIFQGFINQWNTKKVILVNQYLCQPIRAKLGEA